MPELPEVQTVVDTLRPTLLRRRIVAVILYRTDIVDPVGFDFATALVGQTIGKLERRAKRIVFTLDNETRFYIHLGMTGRLTVIDRDEPIAKHTHLIMRLAPESSQSNLNNLEVRFCDPRRFGGVWWMGISPDRGLGPEPLMMRSSQLLSALARTRRPIKSALLDQTLIAGLGNIYVDESLHHAGLHPARPSASLQKIEVHALSKSIKLILRRAIYHGGSTLRDYVDANGDSGRFQNLHRVYGREGEDCQSCKSAIERIILGGRSTHFCPKCQQ